MAVNHTCGICYGPLTKIACKTCSFTMCDMCASKYKIAIGTANPTIQDQCPQCKPPWMKPMTSY